jgi:hypothetical protein
MTQNRITRLILCAFFTVGLFSCTARIDGIINEGGSAEISLRTSLEPRTLALIRSLKGFMGDDSNLPVLDGEAISRSAASAPGIRSISLKNINPSSVEGKISISHVGAFLEAGEGRFITFTEVPGNSSIAVNLTRESAPKIISMLSPELEEYLSALMAPAVLGEDMSKQEYLNLVSSVYGRPLANEIAEAKILVSMDLPRQVKAVKGGASSGRRAEFEIPLLNILVLDQPLNYELMW